jgi:hypothetical protein
MESVGLSRARLGLVNSGFETGTLSGWSQFGTVSVVSGSSHTGAYAAQLGSTSPGGGGFLWQSFTVANNPFGTGTSTATATGTGTGLGTGTRTATATGTGTGTGRPTLSFWTLDVCTSQPMYVYLQDQQGNTLAYIVDDRCTNTGAWTQTTFDLTPFEGMTVTLQFSQLTGLRASTSHFLLDDVVVSIR